ncbi:MAG: hypothetical protein Q8911_00160 [Bacillota bacterium]|nr:hypothetical protein [Bacillota bacterium]
MPVANPVMVKLVGLLLASLLVLSPISLMSSNSNNNIIVTDNKLYYEIRIPDTTGGFTSFGIPTKYPLTPFEFIIISNENGNLRDYFFVNPYRSNPELAKEKFAEFFQQLPKDEKDLLAPWLEKAVRDHDGLIEDLKKKVKGGK